MHLADLLVFDAMENRRDLVSTFIFIDALVDGTLDECGGVGVGLERSDPYLVSVI
jgi:hypothetical protein